MTPRAGFLCAWGALVGLQVLWHGLLFPAHPALLTLAVAPLIAPLPWLLRRTWSRARLLTAYLALLYFVHGVTEALVSPPQRALALIETGLSLLLCALAAVWARTR